MIQFQSFMLENSNTKVFEISSKLVIENHKKIAIYKDAIENLSTCIGKVKIYSSVQVSVFSKSTSGNTFFPHRYHKYFTQMYIKYKVSLT